MTFSNKSVVYFASSALCLGVVIGSTLQKGLDRGEFQDKSIELTQRLQDSKPYGVTSWDLNGDGREDIVIYSQTETNIFIQRRAGGYTPFEKYKKDARDNLEVEVKNLEDSFSKIQSKAGELRVLGAGR